MRRTPSKAQALAVSRTWSLPRGWVVLGAALASWAMMVLMAAGIAQLFSYVAANI